MTLDALDFMKANKDKPFFLYYASWLVHTPSIAGAKHCLKSIVRNLDLIAVIRQLVSARTENPYYCAMVEMLDYYVGQIVPIWKYPGSPASGHFLISNTYVIFTSDNGGMGDVPGEVNTDNFPLDGEN